MGPAHGRAEHHKTSTAPSNSSGMSAKRVRPTSSATSTKSFPGTARFAADRFAQSAFGQVVIFWVLVSFVEQPVSLLACRLAYLRW
jgi:hypothetical protein